MTPERSCDAGRGPANADSPPRVWSILREWQLALLVLLTIVFFHRPLFTQETFYFRDLYLHYMQRKQLLSELVLAGELPLWNEYRQGGEPFVADPSNSALYPGNVLFLVLPPHAAFDLNIVLHFALCVALAYLAARLLGLSRAASLAAAAVYGFCGFTLSLGNLLGLLMAMPYTPLLLAAWHRFLSTSSLRWLLVAVGTGVVQLLAGAPEASVATMLLLLGWTLAVPGVKFGFSKRLLLWMTLVALVIACGAVQIAPTMEMVSQSSRAHSGIEYYNFTEWSLYPTRVPELVIPRYFGHVTPVVDEPYWGWGNKVTRETGSYILSIYFGLVVVALTLLSVYPRRPVGAFDIRLRVLLLSFGLLGLAISFGRFLPFFEVIYHYVPLIGLFRFPIKFMLFAILPVACLVGCAVDLLFKGPQRDPGRGAHQARWGLPPGVIAGFCLVLVAVATAWAVLLVTEPLSDRLLEYLFNQAGNVLVKQALAGSLLHMAAVWSAFGLLLYSRRLGFRQWHRWTLAALLLLDLLAIGWRINFYADRGLLLASPPAVETIQRNAQDGRLYRQREDPSSVVPAVPTPGFRGFARWNVEMLNDDLATLYRIPTVFGPDYTLLGQHRMMVLRRALDSAPWSTRAAILAAAGASLVMTSTPVGASEFERVGEAKGYDSARYFVYRNLLATGLTRFVSRSRVVDNDRQALAIMSAEEFDPRRAVVLHPRPDGSRPPSMSALSAPGTIDTSDDVTIVRNRVSNSSSTFTVATDHAGFLVFSDVAYPGWRVIVDGEPRQLERANLAFSAVFLEPGHHQVTRLYRPWSLIVGAAISGVVTAVLLMFAVANRRRQNR